MRLTPKVRKAMKRAVEVEGADTSFAELVQRDAYSQEPIEPETVPADTELPSDGYSRTSPGIIGAGKRVIVARIDEHGIAFTDLGRKAEDDHTPDLQRQSLIRQYTKRKKDWAEFSAQQEKRINDSSND